MTYLNADTLQGAPITAADAFDLLDIADDDLLARASQLRDQGHGRLISYSRKVFIPLT